MFSTELVRDLQLKLRLWILLHMENLQPVMVDILGPLEAHPLSFLSSHLQI